MYVYVIALIQLQKPWKGNQSKTKTFMNECAWNLPYIELEGMNVEDATKDLEIYEERFLMLKIQYKI